LPRSSLVDRFCRRARSGSFFPPPPGAPTVFPLSRPSKSARLLLALLQQLERSELDVSLSPPFKSAQASLLLARLWQSILSSLASLDVIRVPSLPHAVSYAFPPLHELFVGSGTLTSPVHDALLVFPLSTTFFEITLFGQGM